MNDPDIRILPATEADLPEIAKLARNIWGKHYPGIISEAQIEFMLEWMYSIETLTRELAHQQINFERLLIGDELMGFASYGPTSEPGVFKLHKLYVHQDWQGKGCGTRLLAHCERAAVKLGARRFILAVNRQNHRAIRAYKRNGYAVVDTVVTDIGGGFVMDDFVLAKPLQAPPVKSSIEKPGKTCDV